MSEIDTIIFSIKEKILKAKNPIVFFDCDADGGCAFLQLKNTFENIKTGFPISKDDESQQKGLEKIKKKHDLILFFDTPFLITEFFEKTYNRDVVIVDHHPVILREKIEGEENVLFFNPLDYNLNDGRCTSFWAYKVCGERKENLFYATLASVADFYLLDLVRELYEYDSKLFDVLFRISDEKRDELFDFLKSYSFDDMSVEVQRAKWIQYLWYECDFAIFKYLFDLLYKIERTEEDALRVLKSLSKIEPLNLRGEINAAKSNFFEKFSKAREEYREILSEILKDDSREIVFVEHRDKSTSFNRQISEELSYRKQDAKLIVSFYFKSGKDFCSGSFRSRAEIDVTEVLSECLRGLNGRGGGHKNSGGCSIAVKDFEEFKKRVLSFKVRC